MFSKTLQSITFLVASLMVYTPGVTSVDISGVPQCAFNCGFNAYFSTHSMCSPFDVTCHCKNSYWIGVRKACYTSACSARDISKTRSWGVKTCAEVGVKIVL